MTKKASYKPGDLVMFYGGAHEAPAMILRRAKHGDPIRTLVRGSWVFSKYDGMNLDTCWLLLCGDGLVCIYNQCFIYPLKAE